MIVNSDLIVRKKENSNSVEVVTCTLSLQLLVLGFHPGDGRLLWRVVSIDALHKEQYDCSC